MVQALSTKYRLSVYYASMGRLWEKWLGISYFSG